MRTKMAVSTTVALGLSVIMLVGWRPAGRTPSQEIALQAVNWAKAYAGQLPADFESYSVLSMPYRRAAYKHLPLEVQEELWRKQAESFLLPVDQLSPAQRATRAAFPEFTGEERAVVQAFMDTVVNMSFKPGLTLDQRRKLASGVCARAEKTLGSRKAYVVGSIGPVDPVWQNILTTDVKRGPNQASIFGFASIAATAAERSARSLFERAGLTSRGICTCAVGSVCDCPNGYYCVGGGVSCEQGGGCGCAGWFDCTGSKCADAGGDT